MPPRYSYWTILAGGLPTSFRAAERDDLLPTFNRLQERHPDAEMKWFQRGRLWESPEAAQSEFQKTTRTPRSRLAARRRTSGSARAVQESQAGTQSEGASAAVRQEECWSWSCKGRTRAAETLRWKTNRNGSPKDGSSKGATIQEQIARKRIAQERITPGPDALRHARRPKEGAADDPSPGPVQTAAVAE